MTDQDDRDQAAISGLDQGIAHPARRYNYWLGGKDHFAADRESADVITSAFPTVKLAAVENRRFLERAVGWLAREGGIRQFLDIGTGLPTAGNVHHIAQQITPTSRVVYVDNDPIVLAHARALLVSSPHGATAYLDADLREPQTILTHPDLHATIDLNQPVALILVAVLHFLTDNDRPYELLATLRDALAPGSYIVITHATDDHLSPEQIVQGDQANKRSGVPFQLRSSAAVARFLTGLDIIEPGIVSAVDWQPLLEDGLRPPRDKVSMLAAVARIP